MEGIAMVTSVALITISSIIPPKYPCEHAKERADYRHKKRGDKRDLQRYLTSDQNPGKDILPSSSVPST